ncbi:MAG TPA: hypothetical protein VKZ86_08690 [Cyclobacteriaceae bacterium]|nr:hypothetical protein [Cyclobacteriaceae bacterium]
MNTNANIRPSEATSYLRHFKIAQMNLNQLIWEERLKRRLERAKSR